MATDGPTDSSAPARAELSGVMVVASAISAPGKPKTLYITGGFCAGASEVILGVFKYFNKYDHTFEPQSRYVVHTTVRSLCFSLFPTAE